MNRNVLRIAATAVVTVGAMWSGMGVGHATSALPQTVNDNCGDVFNTSTTVNNTIGASDPVNRSYADIKTAVMSSATVTGYGGTSHLGMPALPATVNEIEFDVTMCGNIPSFATPLTNGDDGLEVTACFDVPNGETIASNPEIIDYGHHGTPVHDGPYPSSSGWKICGWASVGAANAQDYGVATFDPQGTYNFFDVAQLTTSATPSATTATVSAGCTGSFGTNPIGASVSCSASEVKFYFPESWLLFVSAPAPPEQGSNHDSIEKFLTAGGTEAVNNITVESQINTSATALAPSCVPVLNDCFQGLVGLLVTADWAPGGEQCPVGPTPGLCTDGINGTWTGTPGPNAGDGFDLGPTGQSFPIGAVPDPAAASGVSLLNGTVQYYPCASSAPAGTFQDPGDAWAVGGSTVCSSQPGQAVTYPWEYHTVNGRLITPGTAQYQNDFVSVFAP